MQMHTAMGVSLSLGTKVANSILLGKAIMMDVSCVNNGSR